MKDDSPTGEPTSCSAAEVQTGTAELEHLFHGLSAEGQRLLQELEDRLYEVWGLGQNVILLWSPVPEGVVLVAVPFYELAGFMYRNQVVTRPRAIRLGDRSMAGVSSDEYIRRLITGSRLADPTLLKHASRLLEVNPRLLRLSASLADVGVGPVLVDALVKRYSLSHAENRAVVLLDIVGFSLYEPLDQVMLLNSLAHSINLAHERLTGSRVGVDFARSTTGDGFYLWNRDCTVAGNMNLYYLMQLLLADNALARLRAKGTTAPTLKTAFHVGNCYEFYQSEALRPTFYSYIVGDVTIELARIIEHAHPGQILVGQFETRISDPEDPARIRHSITPPRFIEGLQAGLRRLQGVRLSGGGITDIRCYLTGELQDSGRYGVSSYSATDKHGRVHGYYNGKINIYREEGAPLFLGLQHQALRELGVRINDTAHGHG